MRLLIVIFLIVSASGVAQTFEAENGTLSGTTVSTQRSGYTGTGFVTGFDATGDKVTVSITTKAGVYNLYIRYASPSGDKFNFIYINDENTGSVAFPSSPVFAETKVGKVYLKEGPNTIAIVKDWGYFEVDDIRIERSTASDYHPIASALVTPSPSTKSDSLYKFLSKVYGKVILSGQFGGATEFDKIKTLSGKTPVIRGFDLIEYSPSRVAHGSTSTETEKAIDWNKQKGIVTFCWHWNAPKDLIDQPGKEWWRGFYTEATTFDVTKAMNNPSSEEYTLILRDIDAIAVQLKKLKDAKVPVLWRPLHEAEGKWFWWGAKGPEACKWLWKLLFDRLTNYHQLNNLIWVWTSTGSPSAIDWYPGNEFVDIIGADIYLPNGTYSSSFITFDNMVSLYGGKKIIALSENGPIPDPESLFQQSAAWSWFCTWSGNFITDGVSNSSAHIHAVFNHDYVITMDELDKIDDIIVQLEKRKPKNDDTDGGVVLGADESLAAVLQYQNPIRNNRLIISGVNAQRIMKVAVYNLQGKVEFIKEANEIKNGKFEFDFEGKSSGIYLVRVIAPGFTKILRVVKL
jgi:mannan endo-1,4-beta-mannosidase